LDHIRRDGSGGRGNAGYCLIKETPR
jgi:hypothetical protein